jgi:hypothetical protein
VKRWNKKAWPLLAGTKNGNTIRVWCPYCRIHHVHGWDKDCSDSDATHRVAHCLPGGPFRETGYYITVEPIL